MRRNGTQALWSDQMLLVRDGDKNVRVSTCHRYPVVEPSSTYFVHECSRNWFFFKVGEESILFTAAHIVEGIQSGDRLGVKTNDGWKYATVIAAKFGSDVDVAALVVTPRKKGGLVNEDLEGLYFGQAVQFCGFPLKMEQNLKLHDSINLKVQDRPFPLFKTGIFSGIENYKGEQRLLFDAINNKGFSGGPVFANMNRMPVGDQKLRVVGIVSGYIYDSDAKVYQRLPNGDIRETADYYVRPNSGFMYGYCIQTCIRLGADLMKK